MWHMPARIWCLRPGPKISTSYASTPCPSPITSETHLQVHIPSSAPRNPLILPLDPSSGTTVTFLELLLRDPNLSLNFPSPVGRPWAELSARYILRALAWPLPLITCLRSWYDVAFRAQTRQPDVPRSSLWTSPDSGSPLPCPCLKSQSWMEGAGNVWISGCCFSRSIQSSLPLLLLLLLFFWLLCWLSG